MGEDNVAFSLYYKVQKEEWEEEAVCKIRLGLEVFMPACMAGIGHTGEKCFLISIQLKKRILNILYKYGTLATDGHRNPKCT